jgi:hypothetical protein
MASYRFLPNQLKPHKFSKNISIKVIFCENFEYMKSDPAPTSRIPCPLKRFRFSELQSSYDVFLLDRSAGFMYQSKKCFHLPPPQMLIFFFSPPALRQYLPLMYIFCLYFCRFWSYLIIVTSIVPLSFPIIPFSLFPLIFFPLYIFPPNVTRRYLFRGGEEVVFPNILYIYTPADPL